MVYSSPFIPVKATALRGSSPHSKEGCPSCWISSGFLKSQHQVPVQQSTETELYIATHMHKPLSSKAYKSQYSSGKDHKDRKCGHAELLQRPSWPLLMGLSTRPFHAPFCRVREQMLSTTKNSDPSRSGIFTAICQGMWELKLEMSFSS